MKVGGDRRRFVAKVFGGAHVIGIRSAQGSVPAQNIEFVRQFLETEGFPVLNTDVGGEQPRQRALSHRQRPGVREAGGRLRTARAARAALHAHAARLRRRDALRLIRGRRRCRSS